MQKVGCLNCRNTELELGYYEFATVLGQTYQAYFCHSCFVLFQKELNKATPAQTIEYHENLAKLISGK